MIAGFRSTNHPQQIGKRGADDATDDRGTDQAFFDSLSERFGGFTVDVAAAEHNAKCATYWTLEDDGLTMPWVGRVWCNPPFSNLASWVQKAWDEWANEYPPKLIVMLLPANRAEQGWWQDHVEPYRDRPGSPLRVEFIRGRLRFDRPDAVISPKGDRPPLRMLPADLGGVVSAGDSKHAQSGWGGEPLVMCINGPREGAWYTAKFWRALRQAALHDHETPHTGRTLGYVKTGRKTPNRINPQILGHVLAWSPETAEVAS